MADYRIRKPHVFARFIRLLIEQPNGSLNYYAERLGVGCRACQQWLQELEATYSKGPDPVTGRSGVKLWRLKLPREKANAIKKRNLQCESK